MTDLDDKWKTWKSSIIAWQHEGLSELQIHHLLFENDFVVDHQELMRNLISWAVPNPEVRKSDLEDNMFTNIVITPSRSGELRRTLTTQIRDGVDEDEMRAISAVIYDDTQPVPSTAFPYSDSVESHIEHEAHQSRNADPRPKYEASHQSYHRRNASERQQNYYSTRDNEWEIVQSTNSGPDVPYYGESFLFEEEADEPTSLTGESVFQNIELSPRLCGNTTPHSKLSTNQGQKLVLQKMKALLAGLPCRMCCCRDFFDSNKKFPKFQPIIQMLVDETEVNSSLHHVRALCRLIRGSVLSTTNISRLRDALEYHKNLLARPDVRNDVAYAIATLLADMCDGLPDYDEEEDMVSAKQMMWEIYGAESRRYFSSPKALRSKYSHLYDDMRKLPIKGILSTRHSKSVDLRGSLRQTLDDFLAAEAPWSELHRAVYNHRMVLLQSQQLSDMTDFIRRLRPWSHHEGHIHIRADYERVNVVRIASYVSNIFSVNAAHVEWPSILRQDSELTILLTDAVALVFAQKLHALNGLAQATVGATLQLAANAAKSICPDMDADEGAILFFQQSLLHALWACDTSRPLFGVQGLHIGPCETSATWDVQAQRVTDFDHYTSLTLSNRLPDGLEPREDTESAAKRPAFDAEIPQAVNRCWNVRPKSNAVIHALARPMKHVRKMSV